MEFRSFFITGVAFAILFVGCGNEHINSSDKPTDIKLVSKHSIKKSKGNPSIFIPENSYEFPSVVEGKKVTHDFIVKNKGNAELIIDRVKTG